MPFLPLALTLLAQGRPAVLPVPAKALRGPAVVVLLKEGCPCTKECRGMLNALAAACRGKVRLVGLLDADARRAQALGSSAGLRFPILPDPRRTAIRALGGREALDLRLLGAGGRVVGRWDGLSRAHVAALVERAFAKTGQDVALSLAPFTVTTKLGCGF